MVPRKDRRRILFVDDDERLLDGIQRRLRRKFALETAVGPEEGLRMVREQPAYAVIVADMNMPGMDGSAFLEQVHEISPGSIRMMLTGNADLETAVRAVNQGSVFRFISKPCPPEELERFLAAGLDQHMLAASERRAAAAEEANRAKSNFLATVSHELITPLSGIRSSAEILSEFDGISADEQVEFLGAIVDSTIKLESLLSKILKMAELDAGKRRSVPKPVPGARLVEIVQAAAGEGAQVDGVDTMLGFTCRVDATVFGEIVEALLKNARTHGATPDPELRFERCEGGVMFSVVDRGPGVDPGRRDLMFEAFVQNEEVLVDKPAGLGLGLAMSRALARENGGDLRYRPGDDGGSVFECLLPATAAQSLVVEP